MESDTGASFTVAVHLMSEPCLWQWEIRDLARGETVANSWTWTQECSSAWPAPSACR